MTESPEILLPAAAAANQPQLVLRLLADGVAVDVRDKNGMTPLMYASKEGSFEAAKVLIESGADLNARRVDGWNSLMLAAKYGHASVVSHLLLSGADVNALANDGTTALQKASYEGQVEAIRVLLEGGADVNAASASGRTALTNAASQGHLEAVQVLVGHGARVDANNHDELIAARLAAKLGHSNAMTTGSVVIKEDAGKKGGCFVATAVYGSYEAEEVRVLRAFRDSVLARSQAGRLLIRAYYVSSPPLAGMLKNHTRARRAVKDLVLTPIIRAVRQRLSRESDSHKTQQGGYSDGKSRIE